MRIQSVISCTAIVLLTLIWPAKVSAHTIEVYSKEIPWNSEAVQTDSCKIFSINEAIASAEAGDEIIIHEGIYREKVVVNKDNITIRNFESDYVLVTGCEIVDNWDDATGMYPGVKVADVSNIPIETDFTQLFADGKAEMMARYPNNTTGDMLAPMDANSGYAPLSNVYKDAGVNTNGHATVGGTTSLPNVDLTGGIFRGMTGKMRNYVYGTVNSSSGNSVTFKAINNGVWKNDAAIKSTQHKFSWGFVMHKNLIDYPGEWFLDNNKLYYLPQANEQMGNTRIEIQIREKVLVLNNTSGITLEGLNFIAGNVDMQNTSNTIIENCTMRYLYPFWTPNSYGQGNTDNTGIYLSNSLNNRFKDLYVAHSWGNMFTLKDCVNTSFENCITEDFGWVGVFTSAIHINRSDNTNINHCTFGNAGRFQIRIDGGDALVNITDCDFYGAMQMGEDAGPIEATSTGKIGALSLKGSVIAYNKIHDVQGVPVSDGNYNKVKATAFYLEDTQNYTAHHNLVYNIKADNYTGPYDIERVGEFLYMGPRYNAMHEPVNFYNNTIWNVDGNISIWNIEIDNWQELGIAPPDTTGLMESGHFTNNIFMNGPSYKISYVRQVLSSTGGNLGYVTLNPSPSLTTTDFNQFATHCASLNYHFNPQTNVFFNLNDASSNFVNSTDGNFTLLGSSAAKAAGTKIDGITSSDNPDCGALEAGDRVLQAGASLQLPDFKDIANIGTESQSLIQDTKLKLYPNPTHQRITIQGFKKQAENTNLTVYSNNGQVVISKQVNLENGEFKLDVSALKNGCYHIKLVCYPSALSFIKI